jgi:hypothetical protein
MFQQALKIFFESEIGKKLIGQIVFDAVNEALLRDVTLEKHRDEKTGKPLAKPEIVQQKVNVLDYILKNVGYWEAAVRGCQADSAKSFNRSNDIHKLFVGIVNAKRAQILDNKQVSRPDVGCLDSPD